MWLYDRANIYGQLACRGTLPLKIHVHRGCGELLLQGLTRLHMLKTFERRFTVELRTYLRIVRRNWLFIVASTLAGVLLSAAGSLLIAPSYTAHTKLFVAIQNSGSVQELNQGNTFTQARVQSYVETVKTAAVLQPAIDTLGLGVSPAELSRRVVASADIKTVIISISATDSSPVQAAAIAQAVADSLVTVVDGLEAPAEGGTSPVKLSVVAPSTAPSDPSAPNTKLNIISGLLIGLAFGIGIAVLRTVFDNRIRVESDVRRVTDSPLLGSISFDSDAVKKPLLTQAQHQSPRAESFRQIRTNLQFACVSSPSKSILVTSSIPGEGKSTTATNLAIAMAQSGQSVVLVEADLRRPRISEYLGLEREVGLTTALIDKADVMDLLQPWGSDQLHVLAAGQIPPNPSELLGSPKMKETLDKLEASFDAVIIDAPPLLPVTDAAVLARSVGGVVLIIGAAKGKSSDLSRSVTSLDLVGAKLLGVVMNLVPTKGPDAYAYSYYSYSAQDDSLKDSSDNDMTASTVLSR